MKIFFSDSNDAAFNLATEEYLFRGNEDVCFLYVNQPCIIIGCNQYVEREVNAGFCELHDIPVFRRISGGGAVYHDAGNLNYSFIFSRKAGTDYLGSEFLMPVKAVLLKMGVETIEGKRKDLWHTSGYKVSGTASHHHAQRVLQHGTILYDVSFHDLTHALKAVSDALYSKDLNPKGISSVQSPVKNIKNILAEDHLKPLNANEFFKNFALHLEKEIDSIGELVLDENDSSQIEKLIHDKYSQSAWNYKK